MLLARHAQDLEKSGLSDNTIEALGFYSADQWEIVSLLARSRPVGLGLVIPYPGSSPPYFRVKPDDPPLQWGKRPKYLAPKGAGNRAYIPPRTRDAISKPRKPLLITEGEKKAAKADQEGFPCIGISGVWCFLQGKRLIADLADIQWARRRVYLVYDSDIRHNPHIRYAAHVLAWELTGRGALVFVVALPDGQSDEKVGLDDFLVANGRESLRVLLSNAKALVDTRGGGQRRRLVAESGQRCERGPAPSVPGPPRLEAESRRLAKRCGAAHTSGQQPRQSGTAPCGTRRRLGLAVGWKALVRVPVGLDQRNPSHSQVEDATGM